jgi:signal transduction histidine kinase
MVESIRDVTLQRRLEAELLVRNEELETARQLREEFTSAICHELRNILNVLTLGVAVLDRQAAAPAEHKRARMLAAETRRLARLVGDLSDASAIETQRFSLDPLSCDLVELASARVEVHQLATDRHTISIEAAERPILGAWDPERIGQVIDNLISNAIKYSPAGGPVLVSLSRGAGEAYLEVADRGLGIKPEELERLFQPYSRLHDGIGGLGLGLFISRAIVEAHGGSIRVRSEVGRGTTFELALPTCDR